MESDRGRTRRFGAQLGRLLLAYIMAVTLCLPAQAAFADETEHADGAALGEQNTSEADGTLSTRLAGDDASATAAAIAKKAFPEGSEWVVMARDDDFADAMSATGLAGTLDAPILLTDRNGLSGATAQAVRDLGATKAYVIGGKGAIPADLEGELAEAGCQVQGRVFGDESWDTSVACASKIAEHGGNPREDAIIAMSDNFQDALSISSFAYKYQVPIFLETDEAHGHHPTGASQMAIFNLSGTVYVPGGPAAVPESCVEGVFGAERVQRIWGQDGYDTSNQIATYMVERGLLSASTVCVASGAPAPKGVDALAGAALAGRAGGVMLLANDNAAFGEVDTVTIDGVDSNNTPAFLKANASSVANTYILGGTSVMPVTLKNSIDGILHNAHGGTHGTASKIHFIDVGQGDSEFVELPDGKTMLIDAGYAEYGATVIDEIKSLGYSRIDYLVMTHPHADHIGGMPEVINALDIGEVYMPKVAHTTQTYENVLDALAAKGLSVHTAKAGMTIATGDDFAFQIISPMRDDYSNLNDWSTVIRYDVAGKSVLFTGDAGKDVIREANPGKVDVLKVSHHGSYTGTDEALVAELSPTYAVISCGVGNSYGHPHREPLAALKDVQLYRTDLQGTIDMTISAEGIDVNPVGKIEAANLPLAA